MNKLRGSFNILAVKAPGFGDKKKDYLADIAVTVGAKVISDDTGLTFEKADLSVLGRAARIVSRKDTTTIVGGKGTRAAVSARVTALKAQRTAATSKYEKEQLDERIGKLSGGVAVIKVGAATETEMKYLKLKIEDAVNATKAAIAEGIVMGGGAALAKVSQKMMEAFASTKENDFAMGYKVLIEALQAPLRQIARNVGKDEGVVVHAVMHGEEKSGYNALTDTYVEDMFAEGIIDPVKVTRAALEHAASAVAMLLTTEVAIAEEETTSPQPLS